MGHICAECCQRSGIILYKHIQMVLVVGAIVVVVIVVVVVVVVVVVIVSSF